MNPIFLLSVAGALGIVVGAGGSIAFSLSEKSRRQTLEEPTISDGASTVLSVLPQASIVVDATNDVERATPRAYTMGLVRSHSIVPQQELFPVINRVRRDGVIEELELSLVREDGEEVIYGVRVAPLDLDFILLIAEDQTEQKRIETVRSDFINNISKGLQEPVNKISKYQEHQENPNPLMEEQISHLQALTSDVIQLSKLQNMKAGAFEDTFVVNDAVQDAVHQTQKLAQKHSIEVKFVAGQDAQCVGDAELIASAVKNLIDNAILYSPEKTVVGVSTKVIEDQVVITVVDRGEGLSEQEQQRIFERFYRLQDEENSGSGLGLSIVKNIVSLHGGEISVWSQPGKGSTFTIKLPKAATSSLVEPLT
ncbi:MAG: HAMP domain-containing sensor histidine kinase [Micrococcaceae bacterium]